MKLALLVGNTSLRLGLLEGREIRQSRRISWDELVSGGFRPLREMIAGSRPEEVIAGSVRDDRLEALLASLGGEMPPLRVAGRDFRIPVENRYIVPEQVGIDRLLNAVAGHRLWPDSSVVVLDFGSALSITAVSKDGAFLGGLICLGAGAARRALEETAPRLPAVELSPRGGFLARSTEEGIRAGIYWQLSGGAQRILEGLRAEIPPPVRCVATGGDAALLAPAVKGIDCVDPDLTLKGLLFAAEGAGP